ncbi:RlpA-like double-psi beta-barrel domain-containing protein [Lichenicola sp.]|uniref:RlpA-like double-psi beta-barrel domain-containing protein n=1 Tax=Lichenicola sp. TaxID=2804529 RepID=UPI003AFFA46F
MSLRRRTRIVPLAVMIAAGIGIAGCQRRAAAPHPVAAAHYVVGSAWQGDGGAWFYPKEQFDYHATGLAVVQGPHPSSLTADGELFDPEALAGAHQTLQLPAILSVTDLETGRSIQIRLNDRGPAAQGRLLAVTPAAARLLGMHPGTPTRVAISLDSGPSRQLASQVPGSNQLPMTAAPVEAVQEQSLGPPGSPASALPQTTIGAASPAGPQAGDSAPVPDRLPPRVTQGIADPGMLWIDGGQFNQRSYADQVAAEINGAVSSDGQGREVVYSVREGPFQRTPDADAALDQARRAGVTGARIIVE